MCVPNKTKKGNKAFSYLFHTHLLSTISVMVSGRLGAMSRIWHILYATQSKPLNFTFSHLWPQEPRCDWWTPL